jgi:hypothetical protein
MKKILLSTIVLTAFSISIILFEISCKKTANADSPPYSLPVATTTKLGGVIPDGTTISVDGTGKISTVGTVAQQNKLLYMINTPQDNELWTSNYDGSDANKINIILPTGLAIYDNTFTISPDHKTIFFEVYVISSNQEYIYTCNIDGTNPHQIITGGDLGVAY